MNKPIDISFVVPSIRRENWVNIVKSIKENISEFSFEVIFIGPNVNLVPELESEKNIKTIRDFGCPSRSMQIAALLAEGTYLSWVCDDGVFVNGEISKVISTLKSKDSEKYISNWIYTEGDGYLKGDDMRVSDPKTWYKTKHHGDLHLEGIEDYWVVMPLFTIKTSYYHELGVINCFFETINFNLHDLAFRAIRDGAEIQFSDGVVFRLGWQPIGENRTLESCPVLAAFVYNDRPYLNILYGKKNDIPIKINYNTWKKVERVWSRKWKQNI